MNIKVEKQQENKVKLSIDLPQERVESAFNEVYSRIGKEAKVAGFRPGKIPRNILEQHYSKIAHEETLKDLIPQVFREAIDKENIAVIDSPEITDVKLTPNSLSFNASVEVKPDINLSQYKKLKIRSKKCEVLPEDIEKAKDELKKARKIDSLDDNFVKGLGYVSLKVLEDSFERQVYLEKANQNRMDLENQIIEQLKKNSNFKLPQVLINRRQDELVNNAKTELAVHYGYSKEQIAQEEPKIRENFSRMAEDQVRVYLIFEEIANKENIKIDDSMTRNVMELLLREAVWAEE